MLGPQLELQKHNYEEVRSLEKSCTRVDSRLVWSAMVRYTKRFSGDSRKYGGLPSPFWV